MIAFKKEPTPNETSESCEPVEQVQTADEEAVQPNETTISDSRQDAPTQAVVSSTQTRRQSSTLMEVQLDGADVRETVVEVVEWTDNGGGTVDRGGRQKEHVTTFYYVANTNKQCQVGLLSNPKLCAQGLSMGGHNLW